MNLADTSKIAGLWWPLIDDLVAESRTRYLDLASVYVRGSVATGTAVPGRSDLDLVVVTRDEHEIDRAWIRQAVARTHTQHMTSVDIDLAITSVGAILTDRKSGFFIKTQSALVYGEDFARRIAPYRIDADAFSHLFTLELDLKTVRQTLDDGSEELTRTLIFRLVKRVLRAGLELVAEREQVYTRDPPLCSEVFGRYYPERSTKMYEILGYMSGGFADSASALERIEALIGWIARERTRIYPRELPKIAFIDDLGV